MGVTLAVATRQMTDPVDAFEWDTDHQATAIARGQVAIPMAEQAAVAAFVDGRPIAPRRGLMPTTWHRAAPGARLASNPANRSRSAECGLDRADREPSKPLKPRAMRRSLQHHQAKRAPPLDPPDRDRRRLLAMTSPSIAASPLDLDLSGRRALVTGAASGIGRACAVRLAAAGATVLVVDLAEEPAKVLAEEIGGVAYGVDLSDLDAIDGLDLDVDVVVNNAGLQHVARIEEFPPERFSLILRVMLEAPFRILRGALPHMYGRGWGRVVNISSVHGLRASPFKSAYVAAKHGLEGLSKVVALEGAPHGVTSNCVDPAYVRTPLVEQQIADQAVTHAISAEEVVERVMLAPAALKRLIEPVEVAELVAYLCTPQASFITGSSLVMDGGWSAH
jgi:3-hydroxybutyrate dehydrogenase